MRAAVFGETTSSPSVRTVPNTEKRPRRQRSGVLRGGLAFALVFSTLASGHLLMVALNALDLAINQEVYATGGALAHWAGDRPLSAALEELAREATTEEERRVAKQALETVRAGKHLVFHTHRVSPLLAVIPFLLIGGGFLLLLTSRRVAREALQSLLGVFAGLLIWTGGTEYALMIAARVMGLAKSLKFHGGQLYGISGEYVLLKHTWGLILLVVCYLLFLETCRCPFFMWFRRRLHLMRGAVATGRIDNFAPRTAFQYITTMWAGYVLLLWAYDATVFGPGSWLTHAIFFGSFATVGFLLLRLFRQPSTGGAIRYAIGTTVIFWNCVEIAAKWGLFREPWLLLHPVTAVVFFGATALGTWLIVRELRREARQEYGSI